MFINKKNNTLCILSNGYTIAYILMLSAPTKIKWQENNIHYSYYRENITYFLTVQ